MKFKLDIISMIFKIVWLYFALSVEVQISIFLTIFNILAGSYLRKAWPKFLLFPEAPVKNNSPVHLQISILVSQPHKRVVKKRFP